MTSMRLWSPYSPCAILCSKKLLPAGFPESNYNSIISLLWHFNYVIVNSNPQQFCKDYSKVQAFQPPLKCFSLHYLPKLNQLRSDTVRQLYSLFPHIRDSITAASFMQLSLILFINLSFRARMVSWGAVS